MNHRFFTLLVAGFIFLTTHSQAQIITTIAGSVQSTGYSGDGSAATDAQLNNPSDIAVDKSGNLFITDFVNQVIRKVDTFGIITTIAGTGFGAGTAGGGGYSGDGGPATAALLNGPYALAFDASGNLIFADGYNHAVRKISTAGIITTFAGKDTAGYSGNGGPATDAKLNNPVGIAIDKAGNVYIADDHNNVIRKVDPSGIISTFAGNTIAGHTGDGGPATAAALSLPIGIAVDTAGNLFIADANNNVIRKVNKTTGIISTYAGTGAKGYTGDGGQATDAKLDTAQRINFDDSNNLYISDFRNNVIRKVNAAGIISTFAGNGLGAGNDSLEFSGEDSAALNASLCRPQGVAFDLHHRVYICDRANEIIRRIGPAPIIIDHNGVNNLGPAYPALTVYPNPAMGAITINLTANTDEQAQIIITNLLGETVKKFTIPTNKPFIGKLNITPGVYFLSAITTQGKWIKQISVE